MINYAFRLLSLAAVGDLLLVWCSGLVLSFCGLALLAAEDGRLGGLPRHIAEDSGMQLMAVGILTFVLLVGYGCVAVFVPMGELRGKHRRARMKSQAGHTTMLAYFLGLGPLAEVLRLRGDRASKPVTDKLQRAISLHVFGMAGLQSLLRLYYISAIKFAVTQVERGASEPAELLVQPWCLVWTRHLAQGSMTVSIAVAVLGLSLASCARSNGSAASPSDASQDGNPGDGKDE